MSQLGGLAGSPLQVCMDVLVSQHFVGDPVEDIEYEEAQGKNGSGDGVDALGPVHKTLAEHLPIARGDRRRRGEHAGPLHGGAVLRLQTVTQSVAPEVEAAALPHQLLLLWCQEHGETDSVVRIITTNQQPVC